MAFVCTPDEHGAPSRAKRTERGLRLLRSSVFPVERIVPGRSPQRSSACRREHP